MYNNAYYNNNNNNNNDNNNNLSFQPPGYEKELGVQLLFLFALHSERCILQIHICAHSSYQTI